MANEQTIFEFQKNSREVVRIQFTDYKGIALLSIRSFCLDSSTDVWKPTPKGIAIRLEQLPMLKKGIDEAFALWKSPDSNPGSNDSGEDKLPFDGDQFL